LTKVLFFSSIVVFSFYLTNVSWFASYFKISNLYPSSSRSLSFFGHFLHATFTNEYWSICLSPIDILLSVINGSCSFNLSI
jgi:hypothetical protein